MKEEKRVKIFLALTSIHRKISNCDNSAKISWYSEFKNQGLNNPNEINWIKKALIKMKIIKINNNLYSWNKQMTLPNPNLVNGIYKTIKEMKEEERETSKSKEVKPVNKPIINSNPYTFISNSTIGNYQW